MLRGTGATLTLVGGDARALAAWVRAARAAGFVRVAVAPGPSGFAAGTLAALVAAGAGALRARLYAAEAGAHDYHAGLEGSFRATTAMLRAARATRLPVTVTTPLTRSNARVLAALPGLLADVAALGWCVTAWPGGEGGYVPSGRFAGALTPRLGVALPYALQAMVAAERAGVAAAIEGAPLCMLGPLRDRAVAARTRAFAEGCSRCALRGRCAGIDAGYLERLGADELAPVATREAGARGGSSPAPAAGEARARRLQDMFSGPWLEVSEGACWPI